MSAGQVGETPLQVSATSHVPAVRRQVAPALPAGWVHTPTALQRSTVQGCPSSGHGEFTGSNMQVAEQQSPLIRLPSSHCSVGSRCPSPHTIGGTVSNAVSAGGRLNAHGDTALKLPPAVMSQALVPTKLLASKRPVPSIVSPANWRPNAKGATPVKSPPAVMSV